MRVEAVLGVLTLSTIVEPCSSYATGSPEVACNTMIPNHGVSPRFSPSPYSIHVKRDGNTFQVVLEAVKGAFFRGFLLRAKSSGSTYVAGSFIVADPVQKVIECKGIEAITHQSNSTNTRIVTAWRPAPGQKDSVVFVATVVRTKKDFWLNVHSVPTSIRAARQRSVDAPLSCAEGCLTLPEGCPSGRPCSAVFQASSAGNRFRFELTRTLDGSRDVWVAGGLSHRKGMGPSHVIECFRYQGKAEARESYNTDQYQNRVVQARTPGISLQSVVAADGTLQCSWLRDPVTKFGDLEFDLNRQEVVLSMAMGNLDAGTRDKERHTDRTYSRTSVNLTQPGALAGRTSYPVLVKWHGTLMIFSWFVLATFGMTVARHYKLVWAPQKWCDLDVWFVVHRPTMMLAVAVQLAAFVAIFVYLDYTIKWTTPHALFGLGTTALAVAQVLVAFLRPGHHAPWRPAFGCFHHAVARILYAFAIATVALAVAVPAANLTWNVAYVIVIKTSVVLFFAVDNLLNMHGGPPEEGNRIRSVQDKRYRAHILVGFVVGQGSLAGLLILCIWVPSP